MDQTWRRNYLRYKAYFLNLGDAYKNRVDLKAYLEIILSLMTITIFAVFALKPTLITIASLIKEIEAKKATLSQMDKKIGDVRLAKDLYEKNLTGINLLAAAVPDTAKPEVLLRQIEQTSVKNQASVARLTLNEALIKGARNEEEEGKVEEVSPLPEKAEAIKLSVSLTAPIAGYQNLYSFMDEAENLRIPLKIDRILFSRTLNQAREIVIDLTLDARVPFYQK